MQFLIASDALVRRQDEEKTAVSLRPGATLMQRLFREVAADGLNFTFARIEFQSGEGAYRSARHHHGFQQLRFAEKGAINYAPDKFIPEGDIAYFPRGTYYGPQLKDAGIGMTIQLGFGAEKQSGKDWEPFRQEAMETLKATGRFEDDIFIDTDPDTGKERRRDAVDVVYELAAARRSNEKFVIPPEGYEEPILMHPKAFEYYQAAEGVEIKTLGHFFDHPGPQADICIRVVRLSPGGRFALSPERAQIVWTTDAGLLFDGESQPRLACLYSPRGEGEDLASDAVIELFVVDMPRLD